METLAEENYLKAIQRLEEDGKKGASTNDIARRLNTKASSVTDMMKRLADKKLVVYEKYKGARLTASGLKVALRITRKHRLWEVFLVDKLGFKWHEVHEIAEQLEHIQSPELTNRLDKFLGFPRFDPHGDPIPDADGNIKTRPAMILLSECEKGKSGTIVGVQDSSDVFLKHLEKMGLVLGTKVEILNKHEYDDSMEIRINGKTQLTLTHRVAKNLCVVEIKE
ncbi:MAG: metal-dependent transcriptional regulator [Flavobacteriales bacterium]|nr:metal-dependent transcriptional regulator [Flavobacteriales bacterium]